MSSAKTGALPVFEGNKDDEFIIHLTFLQLVKRVLVLWLVHSSITTEKSLFYRDSAAVLIYMSRHRGHWLLL